MSPKLNQNGFSLIEFGVANAITIFLVLAAAGFGVNLKKQFGALNWERQSYEELQNADSYLSNPEMCNKVFLGKDFSAGVIDLTSSLQAAKGQPLFSSQMTIDNAQLQRVSGHPTLAFLHVEFRLADDKPRIQNLPVYYETDISDAVSSCATKPLNSELADPCGP